MFRRLLDIGARYDLPDLTFATILLALRSVLWPYRGFVHDARLYAFQAFNQSLGGAFAQDLFFAFGSQDEYSVFSLLISPMVSLFGIKAAFWMVYMLSSAILVYAEVVLVRRLIPDRNLANLGLIALAVVDVPYGGWGIFLVHESFLTARLPAQGLALLGLHASIERRWLKAALFTLAGLAVHPLMAVSSFAVLLIAFARHQLRNRMLVGCTLLALFATATLVLLRVHWMHALPGVMDESWFAAVREVSWHCFLSKWRFFDWYWVIGSSALVIGSFRWLEPESRILVGALVLVGLGGLITTAGGEFFRSALLVQGQGYRSLWLIEMLAVPLGVLISGRLAQSTHRYARLGVLGIVAFLGNPFLLGPWSAALAPLFIGLCLFLSALWTYFSLKKLNVTREDAIWHGLLGGMFSTAVILSILVGWSAVRLGLSKPIDPLELIHSTGATASRLVWFTGALLALELSSNIIHDRRRLCMLAVSVWLLVSSLTTVLQETSRWREHFQPGYSDREYIAGVIRENSRNRRELYDQQIYWPVDATLIWFELEQTCYYNFAQLVGIAFSRGTALEGRRRAALVRPFEVAEMRRRDLPRNSPGTLRHLEFLGAALEEKPPSRADLVRLASDQKLDWIVVHEEFDGLYTATNGSLFIYDCDAIRSRRMLIHSHSTP